MFAKEALPQFGEIPTKTRPQPGRPQLMQRDKNSLTVVFSILEKDTGWFEP